MHPTISCPGCNTTLRRPAHLTESQRIKCPSCGKTFAPGAENGVATGPTAGQQAALAVSDRDSSAPPAPQRDRPQPPAEPGSRVVPLLIGLGLAVVLLLVCGAVAFTGYIVWQTTASPTGPAQVAQQPTTAPRAPLPPPADKQQGRRPVPQPAPVPRMPQVGQAAPEIEGKDLDDKPMKLSDFRGKVVVLDFWGDWCPWCKSAYTYQRDLVRRMEGRSFVLLGVNCDDTLAQARLVVKNQRLSWRSWWDGKPDMSGPIFTRWGIQSVPSVFVLDTKGVVRSHFDGAPTELQLELAVESLLPARERGRPRWVAPEELLARLGKETQVGPYRMQAPPGFTLQSTPEKEGRQSFLWKYSAFLGGSAQLEVTLVSRASEKPEDAIEKVLAAVPCLRQGWTCTTAARGEVGDLTFYRVNWFGLSTSGKQPMSGFVYAARDGDTLVQIQGSQSGNAGQQYLLAQSATLTLHKPGK